MSTRKTDDRRIATNKRAYHDYHIESTYECGMVLTGTEIKSIRDNGLSLRESYVTVRDGEVYVIGMHIKPYSHGTTQAVDPVRARKLLLHRKQIRTLSAQVHEQGCTLIPTKAYFSPGNRVKLEVGLAKGKKLYDKRHDIAKRDAQRDVEREMKAQRTGQ